MTNAAAGHRIVVDTEPGRVRVILGGVAIAETARALVLREGRLPPIHYIPREDIDPAAISRTDQRSHCPFKGNASYFTLSGGGITAKMPRGATSSRFRRPKRSGATSRSIRTRSTRSR